MSQNPVSAQDLLVALRQVQNVVSKNTTKDVDFHKRRITNAGESVDPNDYVIQDELIEATTLLLKLINGFIQKLGGAFLVKNTDILFNGRVATKPDGYFSLTDGQLTPSWSCGVGDPEGTVAAAIGSLYSRTDGGAGTSLYVKESGTDETGWVAK